MDLKGKKALTLVESLISIILLGAFISSFLGAFFVSRLSTSRAQHRIIAMDMIKEYLEKETGAKYLGGHTGETDYDYYVTVDSPDPLTITPTASITVDNKVYTLTPDPYYPNNAYENYDTGQLLQYESRNYKIIGFVVTWNEDVFGQGVGPACSERATVYIFDHGT